MRTTTGAKQQAKGCAVPPPGAYAGVLRDVPAVFAVTDKAVYASYFKLDQSGNRMIPAQGAWDVVDGKFFPTSDGKPTRCSIRLSSRTCDTARAV